MTDGCSEVERTRKLAPVESGVPPTCSICGAERVRCEAGELCVRGCDDGASEELTGRVGACVPGGTGTMLKVYVAGPITKGNLMHNVHEALRVGTELMKLGFCPFVPHATVLWDMVFPMHYDKWCEYDNEWVKVCDVVLRIPGESKGGDAECSLARASGIPVVYSVPELLEWAKSF